jgi:Carboxypeptidase regulatory-like domain/Polysaccharide lyase family 4, domain II
MKWIALILATASLAFAQSATSLDCAADGSVVNSVSGEPVPRAKVTLTLGGMNYAAATDTSGRWSFSNVACGQAAFTATRVGFLGPAFRGVIRTTPVSLTSGSPAHDVKLELVPQSVVYGKVVDDQGDPLQNVQVSLLGSVVVEGRATFQQRGAANTNDLGEYRVPNLAHGKYIVCAHTAEQGPVVRTGPQTMTAEACYPGPIEGGSASAMDVPAGRETKVDFNLNQIPAVHVRGTVSGLPERRGMGISMTRRAGSSSGGTLPGTVTDGKFDFVALPGTYMLAADYFEAGKHLSARAPVDVGTSDVDNIAVHLDTAFTVAGTVRIESGSGGAEKINAFAINLHPSETLNPTGGVSWERGNASSFTFVDLLPGNYRLDLSPPPPLYLKSATLAGQDLLGGEFSLSAGAGPIAIILRDDGGSIEGDVANADGQAVPGSVMVLRNGRATIVPCSGHFKLQNLAPGDYTVYAWNDSSAVQYANPEWMRRFSGTSVTVAAGQNSQIKLTQQTVPE